MADIVYEHTVAGKQVTLKRRLPGKEAHLLPKLLMDYNGDTDTVVEMGRLAIEAWEFPGNPAKKAAYEEMDVFDELLPLGKVLVGYITARMAAAAEAQATLKN
jgi:hypothetical protein